MLTASPHITVALCSSVPGHVFFCKYGMLKYGVRVHTLVAHRSVFDNNTILSKSVGDFSRVLRPLGNEIYEGSCLCHLANGSFA